MKKQGRKNFFKVLSIVLAILLFFLLTPSYGIAATPTVTTSGDATFPFPSTVTLGGSIFDPEGGAFNYIWVEAIAGGTDTYCTGTVTVAANQVFNLPPCSIDSLDIGKYILTLSVTDVTENMTTLSAPITVTLTDEVAPTLAPVADRSILWPPNNKLVAVTIKTNASDNSGLPPTLNATITCNEPVKLVGKTKKSSVSWDTPVIDQVSGTIKCMLPAQRLGNGSGRVYTISISATDASDNSSTADVKVSVPHDKGKKKGKVN